MMPDILVRGLSPKAIKRLKQSARRNGRSLQSEAKLMIERATAADREEINRMFDRWKARFKGQKLASSVELIREGRER